MKQMSCSSTLTDYVLAYVHLLKYHWFPNQSITIFVLSYAESLLEYLFIWYEDILSKISVYHIIVIVA